MENVSFKKKTPFEYIFICVHTPFRCYGFSFSIDTFMCVCG